MITIREESFSSLKKNWDELAINLTGFQQYSFFKMNEECWSHNSTFFRSLFCRRYLCGIKKVNNTEKIVAIFPVQYFKLLPFLPCHIICNQWSDYNDIIAKNLSNEDLSEFVSKVLKYIHRFYFDIKFIHPDGVLAKINGKNKLRAMSIKGPGVSYKLEIPASLDEFAETRSSLYKHNYIRNKQRLVRKNIDVEMEIIYGKTDKYNAEIDAIYNQRQAIKYNYFFQKLGKKLSQKVDNSWSPSYERANDDNNMLALLRLEGKIIAFASGLIQNSTFYMMQTAFLEEYKKQSPGMLLMGEMITYWSKNKEVKYFDFTRGDETYKKILTDNWPNSGMINLYELK